MDDWQAGDLALCICDPTPNSLSTIRRGAIYTVRDVRMWFDGLCLSFSEGIVGRHGSPWILTPAFRKVSPGAEIVGIEEPRRIPAEVS